MINIVKSFFKLIKTTKLNFFLSIFICQLLAQSNKAVAVEWILNKIMKHQSFFVTRLLSFTNQNLFKAEILLRDFGTDFSKNFIRVFVRLLLMNIRLLSRNWSEWVNFTQVNFCHWYYSYRIVLKRPDKLRGDFVLPKL